MGLIGSVVAGRHDLTTASLPGRYPRLDSVLKIATNRRAAAGFVAARAESSRMLANASAAAARPGRSAAAGAGLELGAHSLNHRTLM